MASWDKTFKLSEHKYLEFEFNWRDNMAREWFVFCLQTRSKQDHPGAEFSFGGLRLFWFGITFYDNRHWDYDNDKFEE